MSHKSFLFQAYKLTQLMKIPLVKGQLFVPDTKNTHHQVLTIPPLALASKTGN
jgi:hypothetical protein